MDAAAEEYVYLLRYKLDIANLHNNYGNVLINQHHWGEAIGQYREALRLDPEIAAAHHNIGLCLREQKSLDGAVEEFRKAIELEPDNASSRLYLGIAVADKGDVNAGIEQFRELIDEDPQNAVAHACLAHAFEILKHTSEAIVELKVAPELKSDFPSAENDFAWNYAAAVDPKLRNPG